MSRYRWIVALLMAIICVLGGYTTLRVVRNYYVGVGREQAAKEIELRHKREMTPEGILGDKSLTFLDKAIDLFFLSSKEESLCESSQNIPKEACPHLSRAISMAELARNQLLLFNGPEKEQLIRKANTRIDDMRARNRRVCDFQYKMDKIVSLLEEAIKHLMSAMILEPAQPKDVRACREYIAAHDLAAVAIKVLKESLDDPTLDKGGKTYRDLSDLLAEMQPQQLTLETRLIELDCSP